MYKNYVYKIIICFLFEIQINWAFSSFIWKSYSCFTVKIFHHGFRIKAKCPNIALKESACSHPCHMTCFHCSEFEVLLYSSEPVSMYSPLPSMPPLFSVLWFIPVVKTQTSPPLGSRISPPPSQSVDNNRNTSFSFSVSKRSLLNMIVEFIIL